MQRESRLQIVKIHCNMANKNQIDIFKTRLPANFCSGMTCKHPGPFRLRSFAHCKGSSPHYFQQHETYPRGKGCKHLAVPISLRSSFIPCDMAVVGNFLRTFLVSCSIYILLYVWVLDGSGRFMNCRQTVCVRNQCSYNPFLNKAPDRISIKYGRFSNGLCVWHLEALRAFTP